MDNPQIVRKLYRLANRLSATAETIRNARRPHHLTPAKSRALRHLRELNRIRDYWADHWKPSRKRLFPPHPIINRNHWQLRHWPGR